MFSYHGSGRVQSSDEWCINVTIPSPPRVSPRLLSPVTAIMRERRDECVRWDQILLNATSLVNSCQFCHCGFQAVSWLCGRRGGGRRHDLSKSCTSLNYPSPCSRTWRGGVKQLTCGPGKYVTARFNPARNPWWNGKFMVKLDTHKQLSNFFPRVFFRICIKALHLQLRGLILFAFYGWHHVLTECPRSENQQQKSVHLLQAMQHTAIRHLFL